ncbi:MAG: hypothetical protein Q9221_004463 [Calogaya cf. arnoldii]
MHHSPSPELQAHECEAAFHHKAYERQAGPKDVSVALEYLAGTQALDSTEDNATILQKASLLCINNKRIARGLPPMTGPELDEQLGRMASQVVDSVRNVCPNATPEEIMQRLHDELAGITPEERERFLVLDSWQIRETKGELQDWPDWVLEAIETGDLRSDYWDTEVNRKRQDLKDYLMGEAGNEAADGP